MIRDNGFTLVELLVSMALAGIVMAGVYSAYYTQQKSYLVQEEVAAMQQSLRASMSTMCREIRMAGYDPTGATNAGIVTNFTAPNDGYGATTNAGNIAFTVDDDDSGVIDNNRFELIAYRLNNGKLQKFSTGTTNWLDVAENIDALNFVYLDADGNATATLTDIRAVQISLVVRTGRADPGFRNDADYQNQAGTTIYTAPGDNYRRRLLSKEVQCRNLGV